MTKTITQEQFEGKYLGKPLDIDHFPLQDPTQCMDVFRAYCEEVWGIPRYAVPPAQYAIDAFNNHPSSTKYFEKVINSPTNYPPKGAVVFLKRNIPGWTGIAGHVVINHNADANRLIVFHQNYPKSTDNCGFYTFPYRVKVLKVKWVDLVAGWLIPKK